MTTTESQTRPPIVVIGAGASGLTAIKCCLEDGLSVICFEKTDDIGGLWRFREDTVDGSESWSTGPVASVMRNTIINSSKEMSSYSDFPPPAHFANYMHHRQQVEYFDLYADEFDLRKHIRLLHEVQHVTPTDDYETTGCWNVTTKDVKTGDIQNIIALGVMICSGHHSHPHIPNFKGLADFKGRVIHAHKYKDSKGFENERVVVVGIGNSGGDIAVELSRVASKVYLSTRRGTWVINRVGLKGLPTDYIHLRRFLFGPNRILPQKVVHYFAEKMHNNRFDHKLYNLKPEYRFFMQHPMVNDSLPNCILSGMLTIKNDVDHFTETGVCFKGEPEREHPLDTIVLATGYRIKFPFIDPSIVSVQSETNAVHLYKNVFPPTRSIHPTLAVIGLIQPLGSIVPISEMQARWVVRVIGRKQQLPSEAVMEADIKRTRQMLAENYYESERNTIQVNYMDYMDDLADLIGVRPRMIRLLFEDPRLFLCCLFGANLPYQYRLEGPHKWSEARQTIMSTSKRIAAPMQTRFLPRPNIKKEGISSMGFGSGISASTMHSLKGLFAFIAMTFGVLMVIICSLM